mgnify:FL=1
MQRLYIANKNYSSWSMRAWLVLTAFNIDFEEALVRFDATNPSFKEQLSHIHANPKVPVLDVGEFKIWDSLAICEYLAEQNPDLALWPKLAHLRAQAPSISCEMHSSFMALRQLCPMNIQAQYSIAEGLALWAQHVELRADVERIEQIWAQRADEHPFLFGDFSIADAFYAPVVMRFKSYALPVSKRSQQYMQQIMQHPAVIQWVNAARAEAA